MQISDELIHTVQRQKKLYDYLKDDLIVSKRLTDDLLKEGNLLVNGLPIHRNRSLNPGDRISIRFKDEVNDYVPVSIPLDILYETDDLLVVNKPAGLVMYDPSNKQIDTLANAISYYYQQVDLKRKIRFVNRLDRDTSGIVIVAKNPYAHQFLEKYSKMREKQYVAIIEGVFPERDIIIDQSIKRTGEGYVVGEGGKQSVTRFRQITTNGKESLILCHLQTGRTHQIRLHLKSIGTPIVGDELYGQPSPLISRQALHALRYSLIDPRKRSLMTIQAPLFNDMNRLINKLFADFDGFYDIM